MSSTIKYETDRLIIRPTNLTDQAFILELLNTPKWLENIGDREVYNLDQAVSYISDKIIPQQEALGYSNYTVIRKADMTKMGTCGIYDREGLEGVDIGFAFLPEYEGKGYAFESAKKVLDLAFTDFGIECISAITTIPNTSSQKLLEKLGLRFVKFMFLEGDPEELMYYELKV
jgi:RimJ/RimL family protein N-acetyltransferase